MATYRGRKPLFDRAQFATVLNMLAGSGPSLIAAATGLSRQAVYRIEADPAAAEGMLELGLDPLACQIFAVLLPRHQARLAGRQEAVTPAAQRRRRHAVNRPGFAGGPNS